MAPRVSIDERMRQLQATNREGNLDQIRELATKSLNDSCHLIVAEAAKIICERAFSSEITGLIEKWNELISHSNPIKSDKGCVAKTAIIEALRLLDCDEPDIYLAGIHYHQVEPAWPQSQDTAENVRASSAFAIAISRRIRIVDKLNALVDLLQGSRSDRIHATKALLETGNESAIPVLRQKLHAGDPEIEVLGICMSGLLELAALPSIPFIAQFLDNPSELVVCEAAAALGQCGQPAATQALIAVSKRCRDHEIQRSLLLSIGLSRDPAAIDFLISQLEKERFAETVLEALKPSCVYESTRTRVRQALEKIDDFELSETFDRMCGADR
ncbi:HEAT repeat domain-containing protein [Schlesneria paludicola]|uniref:HEAT repeat domain-containing protein n=1 Tax=Schlesneria paludicola TaxID=360056 RepID=UPI00029B0716|nr:HEAT repeat domain-containing protein [Schlesneria paludicola]